MMAHRSLRMRIGSTVVCIVMVSAVTRVQAASDDDLGARATWGPPAPAAVREQLYNWLNEQTVDDEALQQIEQRWSRPEAWRPDQVLDALVEAVAQCDPRVRELREFCRQPRRAYELPQTSILDGSQLPKWIVDNLRLFYGQWLAAQQLFDESSDSLAGLAPENVVDPAALLFYQSVAAHRQLDKDRCLSTLLKLLEREDQLPQRYALVAKLMQSDIEPLREDSLDEISRIMGNIQVRLGHGRAGSRVREEEEDVVEKLDKLIEQLEEQASAAAAGAAGGGANAPSSPMEDSMPGGGSGPGNVDPKQLGTNTDWGNLPPKEREEALQQLSKDLPSHYREVIEEYFRKLARDAERP